MLLSERDEFVDIGAYGFDAALHGWDGIRLTLEADSLTVDGTEAFVSNAGSTSAVVTGEVATEDEDFVRLALVVNEGSGTPVFAKFATDYHAWLLEFALQ